MDTANAAVRGQKIGTSTEVGPAEYYELSSDDGRPTGEERPAALLELRPQGEVQRHAADQIVDNPVPRQGGGGGGDLQGLHRGQSSMAFSEQIAEFPDPGENLQDFQPV